MFNQDNQIQVFTSEQFGKVRIIEQNGAPWFVGKDVAEALGYSNVWDALKKHVKKQHKDDLAIRDAIGREQKTTIIDEAGFYALVLRSKLPQAEAFQEWVTSEVLPSIRKHGGYLTPASVEQALTDPDFIIGLATKLKEERQARLLAEQQVNQLAPKADYYDNYMSREDTFTVSSVAKMFGVSSPELFRILKAADWLRKEAFQPYTISPLAPKGVFKTIKLIWAGRTKKDQIRVVSAGVKQIEYLLRAFGKAV